MYIKKNGKGAFLWGVSGPDNCPFCEAEGKKISSFGTEWVFVSEIQTSQEHIETSSSYSMKKGILGAVLLGPVGAVAGMGGKKNFSVAGENKYLITLMCPTCKRTIQVESNKSTNSLDFS